MSRCHPGPQGPSTTIATITQAPWKFTRAAEYIQGLIDGSYPDPVMESPLPLDFSVLNNKAASRSSIVAGLPKFDCWRF